MTALFRRRAGGDDRFQFRVSDELAVPYRGHLLRLRLLEGEPSLGDLSPGSTLRLRGPGGEEREVRILDHAITGGRPSQRRLERTRELDVLISDEDAAGDGSPVAIGWHVEKPGAERGRMAA